MAQGAVGPGKDEGQKRPLFPIKIPDKIRIKLISENMKNPKNSKKSLSGPKNSKKSLSGPPYQRLINQGGSKKRGWRRVRLALESSPTRFSKLFDCFEKKCTVDLTKKATKNALFRTFRTISTFSHFSRISHFFLKITKFYNFFPQKNPKKPCNTPLF